ncbi:MAG: 4-(cytidine 5'-diphospho)-2-C-methyl-D-erythritol kinase [Candidatus Krumholzibacteriia bacterium]
MSSPYPRYRARARAKVNLALEIIRRRRDGYHELETILQSVNLYDELELEFDHSGRIDIDCSDPAIPTGPGSLCYRAVAKVARFCGREIGAKIHIDKRIPTGAGLGGGSSDAAAVLLAADRALGLGASAAELGDLALELGSDVPFMLCGGTMLGQGRGEVLTPLEPLRAGYFLIVKPPISISTADVYKNVNLTLTRHRYRINLKAVNSLLARFPTATFSFRNALEDIVCPSYPQVSEALGELLATRPRHAAMSGSGSALFAIYESEAKAKKLAGEFSVRGFFTAVAKPSARAVDIRP